MAKEYKVGERYYLPVTVAHVYDNDHSYPIHIVFNNGVSAAETLITDDADILLTAEEIISNILLDNNNFMTMPTKTVVVSEEEAKIKTLTDKITSLRFTVATLTDERDGARKQADIFQEEIKKLTADCDKFAKTAKDKADIANKACTERDAAQGDLATAREAIDYLQEENNKLKREVENRTTDYKLMRDNNAVYLSRIATQNEVINALVEKIHRLEGGET